MFNIILTNLCNNILQKKIIIKLETLFIEKNALLNNYKLLSNTNK